MPSDQIPGMSFRIAAIDLRMLFKRLKPAFPKRGQVDRTVVAFHVTPGSLSVVLPGARASTVVETENSFVAYLPFSEFSWVAKDTFHDGEFLTFAFAPGQMTFRGVAVNHPLVRVQTNESEQENAAPAIPPNPSGSIGLPLAAAYHELRKHPAGSFSGNPHLQSAEADIEAILRKVDKLLKPLGIGRTDIERLLNARAEI